MIKRILELSEVTMRKFSTIAILLGLMVGGPLAADVFTVTLTNGSTFVTRYQPHQSETQENKILLRTEFGNWISLPKDVVVSVESDTEAKGFGTVLDSQTIALGSIPTSMSSKGQAEGSVPLDPTAQLLQMMIQQNNPGPPPPAHTNPLVVEPSQSTGIPIGLVRN